MTSLYGLTLALPAKAGIDLPQLHRAPAGEPGPTVTLRPGPVVRTGCPVWSSNDSLDITIERHPSTTTITFADAVFTVDPTGVTYQAPDPQRTLDTFYNPILAVVLPFHQRVALHGLVVDIDRTRVAVVGESGAGKTTLGRQFLARGGTLVADDLLALDTTGVAHPGPPFIRVVDPVPGAPIDPGGKHRLAQDPTPLAASPVDVFVILDREYHQPQPLDLVEALDGLLARPYVPATVHPDELLLRLECLQRALAQATVIGLPPRWRPPEEMAERVLAAAGFTAASCP